jgi:NAD(P)-dependent dehydrogenase (short-subunit alcohol dehydrogenase family)
VKALRATSGMTGKVVVITGGTSGVGRATAREFARRGARVAVLARGTDGLQAAADEIRRAGPQALAIPTDVGAADQVESAADMVERDLGPIDIWVNDAMTTVFAPFVEITGDEFERVTRTTYLGTVNGTRAALRRMRPRDRGVIVQVGSALAYRSIPLQSAYCGAKHAMAGFTSSLRTELLHDRSGVRVTMVHLPAVNTPQFERCATRMPNEPQPVPPIYEPEIAARAIAWAAAHPRREYWIGASTVGTILANRLVPGLLDRYLARTNYDAQQTDTRIQGGRRGNLWMPVPGDPGAHGEFGARSANRSPQVWAARHRTALIAAGAMIAASLSVARARS